MAPPALSPRQSVRALLGAALGLLWAGSLGLVPGVPGGPADLLVWNGTLGLATGFVLARALVPGPGRRGFAWLGLGMLAWGAAGVQWTLGLDEDPGGVLPWWLHLQFLLLYPAAYVGIWLLCFGRGARVGSSTALDGLIAALAIAALAAEVAFEPVVSASGGSEVDVALALSYPVCDLGLLVLLLVGVVAGDGRPSVSHGTLAVALLGFTGADTAWALLGQSGDYGMGTVAIAGFPTAFVLLALAAWAPPGAPARERRGRRPRRRSLLVVPVAAASVALAVLVVAEVRSSPVSVVLAGSAIALVLVRLVLAVREQAALRRSHRLALTDELTGLPNRRAFLEALAGPAARPDDALLILDLDGFGTLNETLGHQAGDDLLRQVGRRLQEVTRQDDVVARLNGDEFGVLARGDGHAVASRLRAVLDEPFPLGGVTVHVEASVGLTTRDGVGDPSLLLRQADQAMEHAKRRRAGIALYEPALGEARHDHVELLGELHLGLRRGELELHFQPKVALRDGSVTGFEALLRWRHPQRGMVPPGAFIAQAEQTTLVHPLTAWVVREALGWAARLRDAGHPAPHVAVNVSGACLTDGRLVEEVRSALEDRGLPGHHLTVELTEHAALVDPAAARVQLERLRLLGVRVSVDDFGTGQSSLSVLHDLPVDELKVDRSFVTGLESDPRRTAIVGSAIELGHRLGLTVVAEGVEDPPTHALLRTLGCDQVQGWLHGRPVPGQALLEPAPSAAAR